MQMLLHTKSHSLGSCRPFSHTRQHSTSCRHKLIVMSNSQQDKKGTAKDPQPGLGLKAVWMGAEQLGNIIGMKKGGSGTATAEPSSKNAQLSRAEALAAIRKDYDVNYFVSGKGDMSAYADDCLFADPFAGFRGVKRFKNNVSNLGSLMEDVDLVLIDWQEADNKLKTKWRFSCILQLPWRPILAAAGGTEHVFDPATGKVVEHIESWDVEPGKVVKSLLKPSAKVPGNQWEVFMAALYAGDGRSIWYAMSSYVLRAALVVGALDAAAALFTGSHMQAVGDGFLGVLVVSCLVTEVFKFSGGMQGGDTGTGGRF